MTGIVQKIHAARGTVVRKEQPLASLDARELELDIRQGKDEMELRRAELQRAEALASAKILSAADLDERRANHEVATRRAIPADHGGITRPSSADASTGRGTEAGG